jgi:hypothetical protein
MNPGEEMVPEAERVLGYNILNAPLRPYPYPHIYVPDVFPPDFYAEIQRHMPHPDSMLPIEQARAVRGYKERFVLDIGRSLDGLTPAQSAFWGGFAGWLLSGRLKSLMLSKFKPFVAHRFEGVQGLVFRDETLLIEDRTNYALGPHTDAPSKVITVIFYLPKDDSQAHMGTSLYVPKDPARRCAGGPHHDRAGFDRVATMPFKPNSMFAFVKSDHTFHGVEKVLDPDVRRWLLLYDIKASVAPPPPDATRP